MRRQGWPAALPVPPERLVAYIDSLPPSLAPNGVKLCMAAVAKHHTGHSMAPPTAHAAVRAALRRRQAVGEAVLVRLNSCGEDLAGLRNRALLLLIQAGGLTPAEVAGDRPGGPALRGWRARPVGAGRGAAGAGGAATPAAR